MVRVGGAKRAVRQERGAAIRDVGWRTKGGTDGRVELHGSVVCGGSWQRVGSVCMGGIMEEVRSEGTEDRH